MSIGYVYLVGAGPGDTGLISQKALEVIDKADCIIYDFLSNEEFVKGSKAEIIYVGKSGSSHTLPQEEISLLIAKKAKEGKVVVRLKGGDPFIFGRGGEEAEVLLEEGVPFEIIPGVSSFYSAPAYAGIPLTHRDCASAFEVITGHRRSDASDDEDITFPSFNPDKTFVFLMGMKNLDYISKRLIEDYNFPVTTPVGVISWGTTPQQQVATGTLTDIADIIKTAELKPPAIIIMGDVVTMRKKLQWFDNRPLFGKKIVVTRSRAQASKMSHELARAGADVIEFPTIEIKPVDNMSACAKAIKELSTYEWTIFTSQNAVEIFFQQLNRDGFDSRHFAGCKIAAIGPATAENLKAYGLVPEIVPEKYVAESLLEELKKQEIKGKRILLPCSADARTVLADGLFEAGASVDRIHIYSSEKPQNIDNDTLEEVKNADLITFASSSTVKHFFALVPEINAEIASIGPVTDEAVKDAGYTSSIVAEKYTIPGMIEAIESYYKEEK